jgi:hypothetical protein
MGNDEPDSRWCQRCWTAKKITGCNVGLVDLAFLVMMTDDYDLGTAAFAGPGQAYSSANRLGETRALAKVRS